MKRQKRQKEQPALENDNLNTKSKGRAPAAYGDVSRGVAGDSE